MASWKQAGLVAALCSTILVGCIPEPDVEHGDSYSEVLEALGRPDYVTKVDVGNTYIITYHYDDIRYIFKDGRVSDINAY